MTVKKTRFKKNFELEAIPAEQLPAEIEGTDVVLIAPQISYKKKTLLNL